MFTSGTGNSQSNYNLTTPLKQTKHMPMPVFTNYALILTWALQQKHTQHKEKGFTKKEIIGKALGYINYKFIGWPWTNGAFSSVFAAFNYNGLLTFDEKTKRWYCGPNLNRYVEHHFINNFTFPNMSKSVAYIYDLAVEYNKIAINEWEQKKLKYKIGKEYFFQ